MDDAVQNLFAYLFAFFIRYFGNSPDGVQRHASLPDCSKENQSQVCPSFRVLFTKKRCGRGRKVKVQLAPVRGCINRIMASYLFVDVYRNDFKRRIIWSLIPSDSPMWLLHGNPLR